MNVADSPIMNPNRGEWSGFSDAAPTTSSQTYSPILSDGIVHSVTADVNSPPSIAEHRTSRKRGFDTITLSSPELENSTWRPSSSTEATLRWSIQQQQQHVAPREIVHMLAFSESEDDDGDQELRLLQQQHDIAVKQHQQYRSLHSTKGSSHSCLIQPRSTNQSVPLNSMPSLGYKTYQPDVVRSIFR
jgi:hypothetical protein